MHYFKYFFPKYLWHDCIFPPFFAEFGAQSYHDEELCAASVDQQQKRLQPP